MMPPCRQSRICTFSCYPDLFKMHSSHSSTIILVVLCSALVSCQYQQQCYNSAQCLPTYRCFNGACISSVECTRNLDCISRGIYYECNNSICIPSDHKICRTDMDCSKNLWNKKCIADRCKHS